MILARIRNAGYSAASFFQQSRDEQGNARQDRRTEPVSERDLDNAMKRVLNEARQQNPEATYSRSPGSSMPFSARSSTNMR